MSPLVEVKRIKTGPQGTFGIMAVRFHADGPPIRTYCTGELPWKNNAPDVSCIPPGNYMGQWLWSPSHSAYKYHIMNVPNRQAVEIHAGNFCGDVTQGFKSNVLGCMLLGTRKGVLDGQEAVIESGAAIQDFETLMGGEAFNLTISEAYSAA